MRRHDSSRRMGRWERPGHQHEWDWTSRPDGMPNFAMDPHKDFAIVAGTLVRVCEWVWWQWKCRIPKDHIATMLGVHIWDVQRYIVKEQGRRLYHWRKGRPMSLFSPVTLRG